MVINDLATSLPCSDEPTISVHKTRSSTFDDTTIKTSPSATDVCLFSFPSTHIGSTIICQVPHLLIFLNEVLEKWLGFSVTILSLVGYVKPMCCVNICCNVHRSVVHLLVADPKDPFEYTLSVGITALKSIVRTAIELCLDC